MRFFDVGQEANGFIAIGQFATGVFALGQVATGVIAIGQLARGVVAIGQLSIGFVTVGMLTGGLVYAVGFGVGGTGKGAILPLVPAPPDRYQLPRTVSWEDVRAGRASGWLEVLIDKARSPLRLLHQGVDIAARLSSELEQGARLHAQLHPEAPVLAYVERGNDGMRAVRLMQIPKQRFFTSGRMVLAAFQLAGLAILAAVVWYVTLVPVGDFFVVAVRDLLTGG